NAHVDDGEGKAAHEIGHRIDGRERDEVVAALEIAQGGRAHGEAFDHPGYVGDLDHVAHVDGAFELDEGAVDDVLHQLLRAEADGKADDAGRGEERGDVEADFR